MHKVDRKNYGQFSQDVTKILENILRLSNMTDMDLTTPTIKSNVLDKAKAFMVTSFASQVTRTRLLNFSSFNENFCHFLSNALETQVAKSTISGAELLRAYALAVVKMKNQLGYVEGFLSIMTRDFAVSDFLDFFGVPVIQDVISDIQSTNPKLASDYLARTKRWTEGT